MEKLKDRLSREYTGHFQQDLNDLASTLIPIGETICIIKEKNTTEIIISIGMIRTMKQQI